MGPQANLFLPLLQGVLEFVVNALHGFGGSELSRGDLSDHGWHFGIEGPAGNEVLHGHGIVACP
jgi:hypothetical protein